MTDETKEILDQYVKARNRYTEEKKNNLVNPRVGSLHDLFIFNLKETTL